MPPFTLPFNPRIANGIVRRGFVRINCKKKKENEISEKDRKIIVAFGKWRLLRTVGEIEDDVYYRM